jgi:gluconokinase
MSSLAKKKPDLFIVMGVSGTGKSSVAQKIAEELSFVFIDADDFHSTKAKLHMAENKPLTDEMRIPWLARITDHLILLYSQGHSVALAYSGLKLAHRQLFRQLPFSYHFFYLTADKDVIAKRMSQRQNHFFSLGLLDSQFTAMEPPLSNESDVSTINVSRHFSEVTDDINSLTKKIMKENNNA